MIAFLALVLALTGDISSEATEKCEAYVRRARAAYRTPAFADYKTSVVTDRVYAVERPQYHQPGARTVRWIHVEGAANFRDIGGWTGLRTGLVYRGTEVNCQTNPANFGKNQKKSHDLFATARGLKTLSEELKIRTDLDLRAPQESPTPDETPIPGAKLLRIPTGNYADGLRGLARALRVFADRANYPIYFHCYGGADRTGTLALALEGLCGVHEADCAVDYELTTFGLGTRQRFDHVFFFASAVAELKKQSGATFKEKTAQFAERVLGLTADEIASIRTILTGSPEGLASSPCAVAHPEMYAAPAYPPVMGRDYWVYLRADGLSRGESKDPLAQLPLFTETALVYTGADAAYRDDHVFPRITDEFGRTQCDLDAIERRTKPGKPYVICISNRRNFKTVRAPVPAMDVAHERQWAREHPDFFCFRSTAEIANDTGSLIRGAAPTNRWARYKDGDRYAMTKALEDYYRTQVALHYGDAARCIGFRGYCYSADFVTAAQGARALVGETTGTWGKDSEWRWNVSPMFLRGAGRQFDVPWMWYAALFVNGMKRDGSWQNESWPMTRSPAKPGASAWEHGGISPSLLRRTCFFAYLTGANALEPEGFDAWGVRPKADKSLALAPHGEAFNSAFEFARAHPDRGQPYCPVAILVPYNQGYPTIGGVSFCSSSREYGAPDHQVDAVFSTLMPTRDQEAAFREGREGFLRNSPFAQMYDVLVPDSPQAEEAFLKVLARYPVAILTGSYPDVPALRRKLARYLAAGGTLYAPKALASAVPPAPAGKGRVVFSASDWMTPPFTEKSLGATRRGQLAFPELAALFTELEAALFPFRVTGDVLYGLNRADGHDWLWAVNNRGVTKWVDTEAAVDPAQASKIRVTIQPAAWVRADKVTELVTGRPVTVVHGSFDFTVPAGGVAVFEIPKPARR